MQVSVKLYSFAFCFILWWLPQISQCQSVVLRSADSLLATGHLKMAETRYLDFILSRSDASINDAVWLKMAYISQQQKSLVNELYYLNKLNNRKPTEELIIKMDDLGKQYGLKGYETSDFSFFFLIIKKYLGYLVLLLLILAFYVFVVMSLKSFRKERIYVTQKITFVVFLISVIILTNLPDIYSSGIVKNAVSVLRTNPSAAAEVSGVVARGNKLQFFGKRDEWLLTFWDDTWCFVKRTDVLLIN